ncbi:histidine kinase [Telmatobacter sp. DSM 110680]|uniref:Histidine kinase n=1 Tax=Telmatobacter sp. DSM 110680 TaxID=3036704 RepID=A0AAU7DQF5_9BACT
MASSVPGMKEGAKFLKLGTAPVYLRRLVVSILCWTGVVLLESSQVFMNDAARGYVLPSMHYIAWAVFNWYVYAALTPLIFELGLRYPITGRNWAVHLIVPHALACVGLMVVQAICRGIAGSIYSMSHELQATSIALTSEWFEKRGLLGFIAYCVIAIIAGFAYLREEMRQRELRQAQLETRLASAELEKLRMQIHPHFLFNTLQAAITLVQEDPHAAEDVLLRLSQLLRISLDQMECNEISLARELEFLDLYTGIQRARFGDRLAVEIHAEPDTLSLLIPPLILQPLVENAIRHGIGKHKGKDCVEIFAHKKDGGLQIEVWNANSMAEEEGEKLFMRGVGLRNTRARLEQLYGTKGQLIFRSLARGGVVVLISVPAHESVPAESQTVVEAAS